MKDNFWNDENVKDMIFTKIINPNCLIGGDIPKWMEEYKNEKSKEKDIPKDWEVLTYTKRENEQAEIYSVKRLMDETILQIGDEVTPQYFFETYKIKSFRIDGAYMMANFEPPINNNPNSFCNINYLRKVKPKVPLFTTEDGVEIFENDGYFKLYSDFTFSFYNATNGGMYPKDYTEKTFSKREKLQEYILLNKPIEVSYNDISKSFMEYGNVPFYAFDALKFFFKKIHKLI